MPVSGVPLPSMRAFERTRSRYALALVLSLISYLGAQDAHAEQTESERRAADLFDEGLRASERGENVAALRLFREVYALVPVPEARWNIVATQVRLGMYVEAHHELEEYLAAFDKLTPDRLKEAAELRDRLEKKLARLTLEVDPPGAVTLLDGEPSARQIWLAPGEHRLHVTAPGWLPDQRSMSLKAGERPAISIKLVPRPPPPPPPPPHQLWAGLTLIGIGAAGLATGAILGGLAIERNSTMESLCPNPTCGEPERSVFHEVAADASRIADGSTFAFVLGGAVSAFGAAVALTPSYPHADPRLGHAVSLSFVPPPGGEGGILLAQGEF